MLETYLKQCFEEKTKECEQCSQDIKNLQLMKKEIPCEKGKEELLEFLEGMERAKQALLNRKEIQREELKKLLKLYEAN